MQGGNHHQKGGLDPGGWAAIVGAIVASMTGYGYKIDKQKTTNDAADSLRAEYDERLRAAEQKEKENEELKRSQETIKASLAKITDERDNLKNEKKSREETQKGIDKQTQEFRNASTETLKGAIEGVIDTFRQQYPHLVSPPGSEDQIRKVLEYPTTYQAKLTRPTLPVFYEKQVLPTLQRIVNPPKGGKRKKRTKEPWSPPAAPAPVEEVVPEPAPAAAEAAPAPVKEAVPPPQDRAQEAEVAPMTTTPTPSIQESAIALYRELLERVNSPGTAENVREQAKQSLPMVRAQLATFEEGRRVLENEPPTMTQEIQRAEALSKFAVVGIPGGPGSPASYGPKDIPSYEQFAAIYLNAIHNATISPAKREAERSKTRRAWADAAVLAQKGAPAAPAAETEDTAVTPAQKKKDEAAKKAAETIIGKFETAFKAAEAALAKDVPKSQQKSILDQKRSLSEAFGKARKLVGTKPETKRKRFGLFGGAVTLYEVATEVEWNEMNTPEKAEDVLKQLQDATKTYESAVKKAAPAKAPPTTIHDGILKDVPLFLKKVSGIIDEIKKMKKGLVDGMKEIPKPEEYRGGCAVRVIVDRLESILDKLGPLVDSRYADLKKAFETYKKETEGLPIYDTAIKRDEAKLEQSKASIDTAVKELNADIESLFAFTERMLALKGGARGLEKVHVLMDDIELGTYALKKYMVNILGLKDSFDKILGIIDRVKDRRLETPAEQAEEKRMCPVQVEEMSKELVPTVPLEYGDEVNMSTNPLFRGKKSAAAPAAAPGEAAPAATSAAAAAAAAAANAPPLPPVPDTASEAAPGEAVPEEAAPEVAAPAAASETQTELDKAVQEEKQKREAEDAEKAAAPAPSSKRSLLGSLSRKSGRWERFVEASKNAAALKAAKEPAVSEPISKEQKAFEEAMKRIPDAPRASAKEADEATRALGEAAEGLRRTTEKRPRGRGGKARRSRKSTLKKRRGGKQNVRGSRRRKNRSDRSHSHSR